MINPRRPVSDTLNRQSILQPSSGFANGLQLGYSEASRPWPHALFPFSFCSFARL